MADHQTLRVLISLYMDQETSDQETEIVREHLRECPECRAYYHDLQQVSRTLRTWPDEALSPDAEQGILTGKQEGRIMKTNTTWKAFGGVLATLVIVGGAFLILNQRPRLMDTAGVVQKETAPSRPQTTQKLAYLNPPSPRKDQEILKEKRTKVFPSSTTASIANKGISSAPRPVRQSLAALSDKVTVSKRIAYGRKRTLTASLKTKQAVNVSAESFAPMMEEAKVMGGAPALQGLRAETVIWPPRPYPPIPPSSEPYNREQYDRIYENPFLSAKENPLSTFSIDVDTASYSNVRRFLNHDQMPPEDAVRIEEMVNYFTYQYPQPKGDAPFSITTKIGACPWNPKHQLALIGLKGKTFQEKEIPASNLVFLIDVSGSMNQPNKLPLLKKAYKMMARQLTDKQRVAIVVYAGAAGEVLESTPGNEQYKILQAIDRLRAGGSTAGGAGLRLAYQIAQKNFIPGGNNRVILATDGDFNVGLSSNAAMVRLIEEKREQGIFLTVLGFGMGNYQDSRLEQIADKGNGNYYYIDTEQEAKKVLVHELGSTLFTIAKDVKIQIEFNPGRVRAYRLIGYENRLLAKEDFRDDTKDAGELGAGHTVTALYEIVPVGLDDKTVKDQQIDLSYQASTVKPSRDFMTVKLRYKKPDEDKSRLIKRIVDDAAILATDDQDFQFAASVVEFGLLLRDSRFKGTATYEDVLKRAKAALGKDRFGYRKEFLELVEKAKRLDTRSNPKGIIFKGQ